MRDYYMHITAINLGYLLFIFISWGCLTTPTFDWPHHKKKVETMDAPQNKRFYGKMECLPLWPTYLGEKGRTLGKTYGIKTRCYWEYPLGNTLGTQGTCWEPDGKPFGT
jgi:hypothetical protein